MRRVVAREIARGAAADVIDVVSDEAPRPREGWTVVEVKAAALNRHDLWSIHGVGVRPEQFPLPIGSDVAGVTKDGREVVVHAMVFDPDATDGELLDPHRTMLAETSGGTLADYVLVPTRNLVDKPAELSFDSAACLPTAWLTAFHMLFDKGRAVPGQTVLIQGAGGGVSTAATMLARAAGLRVWVTSRTEDKLAAALEMGADAVFTCGARLPERVDLVIETVGAATWDHSLRSVRAGGTIVVAGATAGNLVTVDLMPLFLRHISILGSTMGRIADLRRLVAFCATRRIEPPIDSVYPIDRARDAVERLESGAPVGKIVLHP